MIDIEDTVEQRLYNLQLQQLYEMRKLNHPNPLVRFGSKVFSQSDEDGITLEICKRVKMEKGTFIEFGVANGMENNTLALLACGWKGEWFGGENLSFDPTHSPRLNFSKEWITRENIFKLTSDAIQRLQNNDLDLISLDLDGNDFYFIEELLKNGVLPKVFVVESNAKFIPPIHFSIEYNPKNHWEGDDYQGASLTTLNELFLKFNYKLVCCNSATGANAFFVKNDFENEFKDVPDNIENIFVPMNYNLYNYFGHKSSLKTILRCIS